MPRSNSATIPSCVVNWWRLVDRPRGGVAAASYEARVYGVRSAMPSVTAKRRCFELIFVKPRFKVYRIVSEQIRAVFAEHTNLIEPLSLDEAYLDRAVHHLTKVIPDPSFVDPDHLVHHAVLSSRHPLRRSFRHDRRSRQI